MRRLYARTRKEETDFSENDCVGFLRHRRLLAERACYTNKDVNGMALHFPDRVSKLVNDQTQRGLHQVDQPAVR